MVKLEEVSEDYKDDDFVDDSSSSIEDDASSIASDVSDLSDIDHETVYDRIVALREIIPFKQRRQIANAYNTLSSFGKTGIKWAGSGAWVLTTTAVLLGLPLALAVEQEAMIEEQIRAQESQQQVGINLITIIEANY